jgi:flavin reductase (DIM6/NTAB) family NADH-FMN oxidoreductase RutF
MQTINHIELQNMEQRYRAAFINSLGGFKSVVLIGTKDKEGQENLAIFNSFFHLSANPALCGIIVRPDSVERHTLENIENTGFYTINHLNQHIYEKGHQTSARYPKALSEFEATGLGSEYLDDFFAPFVAQSNIKFGVEWCEKHELKINGTTLLIGKILDIYLPEGIISSDGFVDIEKAGTITCSGLDSYHTTTRLARLSYAKPNKDLTKIDF